VILAVVVGGGGDGWKRGRKEGRKEGRVGQTMIVGQ
jgi:hypothetical protein